MSKKEDVRVQQEADKKIVSECRGYWERCAPLYRRALKKLQLLDATDNGDMWRALKAKFPNFQVLPDSNWVSYVKNNILASLYTTTKSAELTFTSDLDKEAITHLNIALEHIWDTDNVGYYQFLAGERAALCNMGITQVGWDEHFKENGRKGRVSFKNIDPINFRRDPYATDLDTAKWCAVVEVYDKHYFKSHPNYKEAFSNYAGKDSVATSFSKPDYISGPVKAGNEDHHTLLIYWVKTDAGKINEYHIINNEYLLYKKEDIKPSKFPFAILYCNLPSSGLIGTSEPAKIFANSVAYNTLNSVALTAEYKNQRPPKFISTQSGLNVKAFAKHGDEADRTFIVNGDASKAVHYHQFPSVSNTLDKELQNLGKDIQDISGVDGRYTGRDTGSIITTGGTEEMLNRVTLIDTPKIMLFEYYVKRLTDLVLRNMIEFAPTRTYITKDKENQGEYVELKIDFPKIPKSVILNYNIQISSELPKNKQRVMAWANTLMEKQMQYQEANMQVDLITAEEWLMYQDIPYKEQLLERMGIQRDASILEETAQNIYEYSEMIDQGVPPEDALLQTAQGAMNRRQGKPTPLEENTAPTMQTSLSPDNLTGGIEI